MSNWAKAIKYLESRVYEEGLTTVLNRKSKVLELFEYGGIDYCDAFCDLKILEALQFGDVPNENQVLALLEIDCGAEFRTYDELCEA